jgi:hypothetical protein
VLLVGVTSIGLAGDHAVRSIPFGAASEHAARAWLEHAGSAPPGLWMMLLAGAVFVVATGATRGILGCLVLAGVTLRVAIFASAIYREATNLVTATAAAFPLWTVAWLAGMVVLFAPLAGGIGPLKAGNGRRTLALGAGLLALALVLRLAAAPLYADLAAHLTAR